jgi:hypothetical protein
MGSRRVNSRVERAPGAYGGVHDDAYVQPVLVGRLTAAVLTYALNGRRFGGRSRFSLLGHRGAAAPGGGHDQEVEKR